MVNLNMISHAHRDVPWVAFDAMPNKITDGAASGKDADFSDAEILFNHNPSRVPMTPAVSLSLPSISN